MKPEGGGHHDVSCSYCDATKCAPDVVTFARCLGIQCNIWGRAQDHRQLTHKLRLLRGGGKKETGYRALRWQTMLSDDGDNAGVLGNYDVLVWLPRKTALFLFEYHDKDFRATVSGLPPLPAPQDRDEFIDVLGIVQNEEIRDLGYTDCA